MKMCERKKKTIINWSTYNEGLKTRGSIQLIITDAMLASWYNKQKRVGKGKPNVYSDSTVKYMMLISEVYSLPYRQTEGFLRELVRQQGHEGIETPVCSIMSKRPQNIDSEMLQIRQLRQRGEKIQLILDASGIKVRGEHEWNERSHGKWRKRKWKKLHIGIDRDTRQIVAATLTDNDVHDGEEFSKLLKQAQAHGLSIDKCYADGAYSWHAHFDQLERSGITPRITLPKNAIITGERKEDAIMLKRHRDRALIEMYDMGGMEVWKKKTDYHQRSLVENTFSRLKRIFGEFLSPKRDDVRYARMMIRLELLNTFAAIALPQYADIIAT